MELWLVSWRGIGSLAAPRASDRPLPVSPSLPLAWCAAGASWQTKLNISSTHGSIGAVFEGGAFEPGLRTLVVELQATMRRGRKAQRQNHPPTSWPL
jgi:hypothetical protein